MLREQKKEISKQNEVSFALCLMLCFPQISNSIPNICNNLLGHTVPALTVLIFALYYASIIGVCFHCMGLMSLSRFIITGILIFGLVLTYAFNLKARAYIWTNLFDIRNNPIYQILIYAYIAFLLSDYLHDVSRFLHILRWFSTVSVLLSLLHYISGIIASHPPQYMTFSYNALFPTAFLWTCTFSKWSIILAVIGTILIFVAGCRGALLCLLLGVVIYYLFFKTSKPANRFLAIFFSIIVILILMLFWEQIMTGLVHLMENLGINSRNIEKIINNDFLSDSGRSRLQRIIRNRIRISGFGLFGDRTLTNGHYAHSIFYELMADFGWPLGGMLFIAWIVLILSALIKADEPGQRLICVLLPSGCFKLFLSGSFLSQEPAFYMLLGVSINCIMLYNKKKALNNYLNPFLRPTKQFIKPDSLNFHQNESPN